MVNITLLLEGETSGFFFESETFVTFPAQGILKEKIIFCDILVCISSPFYALRGK